MGTPPSVLVASLMGGITVLVGLLMVSSFEYFSPKSLKVKGNVPFVAMVFAALVFAVVLADPPLVMLVLFSLYALSGPVMHYRKRVQGDREDPQPPGGQGR